MFFMAGMTMIFSLAAVNIGGDGKDLIVLMDGFLSYNDGGFGADTYIIAGYDKGADHSIAISTTVQFVQGEDKIDLSDLLSTSNAAFDINYIKDAATDLGANISIDLLHFHTAGGETMSGTLIINGISDPKALPRPILYSPVG